MINSFWYRLYALDSQAIVLPLLYSRYRVLPLPLSRSNSRSLAVSLSEARCRSRSLALVLSLPPSPSRSRFLVKELLSCAYARAYMHAPVSDCVFLDASSHLYKRSVGPSVRRFF